MKKVLSSVFLVGLMLLSTAAVLGAPVTQVPLIGTTPIYTEEKFAPLVFLDSTGGRALIDDPYGPFESGDIAERNNNYAFTGEQVVWDVLVWDRNGVEKIKDVFSGWSTQSNGPTDPELQSNCRVGTQLGNGASLATAGYNNVRQPGDTAAQTTFNTATMRIYECTLTVEPTCSGQKWFGVKAVDLDDLSGRMAEAESWYCNPSVDLTVSGAINFGTLGPGEQGSSTFAVKNNAATDSGVEVILLISGKDFYDPTSSGAKCPTSNVLNLQGDGTLFTTGFWYTATQGANSVPRKRIPYGLDITNADPIFSSGNGMLPEMAPPLITTSPGAEASMTLHLGIPQPCNGQFTDGQIYLYAIPV